MTLLLLAQVPSDDTLLLLVQVPSDDTLLLLAQVPSDDTLLLLIHVPSDDSILLIQVPETILLRPYFLLPVQMSIFSARRAARHKFMRETSSSPFEAMKAVAELNEGS